MCRDGIEDYLVEEYDDIQGSQFVVDTFLSERWAAAVTYRPDTDFGQSQYALCGLRLSDTQLFDSSILAFEFGPPGFEPEHLAVTDSGGLVLGGSIGGPPSRRGIRRRGATVGRRGAGG